MNIIAVVKVVAAVAKMAIKRAVYQPQKPLFVKSTRS